MSTYTQGYDYDYDYDYAKPNNLDLLFFTSDNDIVPPSPDLFETELDSFIAEIDNSQQKIGYYAADSSDAFSFLRSEIPTLGPPSTFTMSSDSAYDTQTTYSSEHCFSNYTGSVYSPTTYTNPSEIGIQGLDLNTLDFSAQSAGPIIEPTIDPTSFGTLPFTQDEEFVPPRSYSDYTPSSHSVDSYPQISTVSPNHTTPSPATPDPSNRKVPQDPRRRFKCQLCFHAFTRDYNLKTHMDTHNPNRVKPFVCHHRSCRRSFSRKHDLGRHLVSIHHDDSLLPSRPFARKVGVDKRPRARCEECGKSFFGKETTSTCSCRDEK